MKTSNLISLVAVIILISALGIFYAVGKPGSDNGTAALSPTAERQATVYYSSTCGCCGNYISYLRNLDFSVDARQVQDMSAVKTEFGIPQEMTSCHTSVIGGYVVEGHMPVAAIKKLLEEKPDIKGIALPGMPDGSPGMGGTKNEIWKIYELGGEVGKVFMEI